MARSRFALRRLATLIAVLTALLAASEARAADPIEGHWSWLGGTMSVQATGAGSYSGVDLTGAVFCSSAGEQLWRIDSGSAPSYSGSVHWVKTDDCDSLGFYPGTFRLSGNGGPGTGMQICSTGPGGQSECNSASKIRDFGTSCVAGRAQAPCAQGFTDPARSILDQILKVGYDAIDALFLDDLRKLVDPNTSELEKVIIIASYLVPVPGGFIVGKAAKGLLKVLGPKAIALLGKARGLLVKSCALAKAGSRGIAAAQGCTSAAVRGLRDALKKGFRGPEAQKLINRVVLYPTGKLIGKKSRGAQLVPGGKNEAKRIYRKLTALAQKTTTSGSGKNKVFITQVPGKQTVSLRSKSLSRQQGEVTGPTVEIVTGRGKGKKVIKLHF